MIVFKNIFGILLVFTGFFYGIVFIFKNWKNQFGSRSVTLKWFLAEAYSVIVFPFVSCKKRMNVG